MSLSARSSRTVPLAEINLTPMIDVMLVLLMIFMIVVPALAAMVNLPIATHSDHNPELEGDVVLTIHANGSYELVASGVLPGTLRIWSVEKELQRLYAGTRDPILYLKADSTLPFGVIDQAMVIARRAGVRVLGAVTERKVQPMM